MPFGLSDVGSTFQRMANNIFQDFITAGVVIVYLDDILIHTSTWQEHISLLQNVKQRIQDNNLQLQLKKCRWGCTKLKFLGYIISSTGIEMDPAKIQSITAFPQPTSVKAVQSFLGLVNFSLRFVPNLASITKPLRTLLNQGQKFSWTDDCQQSFTHLKLLVQQAAILAHPDFSLPFRLQIDASNFGLGALLMKENKEGQWQPIAYISRSLVKAEQNYSTTEKELLAIVWAFQKFHPYLHGSTTLVETDHQPLVSLLHKNHPPGRLLRWVLALQEYKFTIKYCKGNTNIVADSLSRQEYQFTQFCPQQIETPIDWAKLAASQQADPKAREIVDALQQLGCLKSISS